jgi:hypothetical protein
MYFVGYYYLVDSTYGCYKGFLPPYRNERYHLETFRRGRPQPRTDKELFNYRHSSLRSMVERTFGILRIDSQFWKICPRTRYQTNDYL